MNAEAEPPDPAAVFACALSLWQDCMKQRAAGFNPSECYNGGDEFMRVVMRAATCFETWASRHVAFDELGETWPYYMEDKFGEACIAVLGAEGLTHFNEDDALCVALHLRLPIELCDGLPLPVQLVAPNSVRGGFVALRIRTMRVLHETNEFQPYTSSDHPFDEDFGLPFFALYGVGEEGGLEQIVNRDTYGEVLRLARLLAPGIAFPDRVVVNATR